MRWIRVIADDLTGACDVAAALLWMHHGVVVANPSRWMGSADDDESGPLVVRNTQSRTLPPETAAARVRAALADLSETWSGVVLKKIDTGLRGPIGAEIDAAMDAAGAELALVVPAIPEAGRATVHGRQLVDGVPVHQTAFAHDPQNPVTDCRVGAVIESTSRRRTGNVGVEELVRSGVSDALNRCRAEGATVIVGDAQTDDDIARWMTGLDVWRTAMPRYYGRRSLVVVGSTGIARALFRFATSSGRRHPAPIEVPAARSAGVLVVAGSAHPTTHDQLGHADRRGLIRLLSVDVDAPAEAGSAAARELREGRHVALAVPAERGDGARAVAAVTTATGIALGRATPHALLVVGGETAFHVLAAIGDPRLWIDCSPAPLVVRTTVLDGPLAGLPLVTKGGSTGPPERLADLVAELADE